jgi:uncharacterized protein (TIGR02611 family)
VKRFVTAVVGGLLTIIGVVLLVLPGPGFVVIALGLAVLAREFTWAKRPLDYAMKRADEGLNQVARSWVYAALDALAGVVLIAVGVLDLTVGLPIIEVVGDIFVIPSGLFLVGTVFYARHRRPRRQQPDHSIDRG